MADLEELAAGLYALTPAQFVAARSEAAAAARAAGDAATAAAVSRLRKPTVSAWLVNQLVRTAPDTVAGVLALGPALLEATRAGDAAALRDLAGHRRLLLADLTRRARGIADAADQAFTAATQREIESTFTAAATDEGTAAQVLTGRLVGAVETTGFGLDVGPDHLAPAPVRPTVAGAQGRGTARTPAVARPAPVTGEEQVSPGPTAQELEATAARAAEIAEAEQTLSTARLQAADAAAELSAASARLEEAADAESLAADALRSARARLSDARADVTAAKADARAAERAVTEALAELDRVRRRR